jgi:acyl carrier protein
MGSNVHSEIRAFVIQNFTFGREDAIVDDESFLDAGLIDSTGVLELVGFLEERFGITVADEDLVPANLDSVVRVARFVAQKLDGTGSRDAG